MIPALLALITAIGSWIALQQMLIARTKLNNDLFDRRFAIYWATRIYIRDILRNKGATQEDGVKWWTVAAAAPFLFEKDLANYIKEISDRGSKIRGTIDGSSASDSSRKCWRGEEQSDDAANELFAVQSTSVTLYPPSGRHSALHGAAEIRRSPFVNHASSRGFWPYRQSGAGRHAGRG